jgi:hypothetical protein
MYKIKFTLGDWSGDGHSIRETFIVNSNMTVQNVREIHFKSEEVLGFDIGDICSEYGESWISKDFYYELQELLDLKVNEDLDDEYWSDTQGRYYFETSEELLDIWLRCLQKIDPTLILTRIQEEEIPDIHFSGYDKKGRHLNNPGYGLYQ